VNGPAEWTGDLVAAGDPPTTALVAVGRNSVLSFDTTNHLHPFRCVLPPMN
jgi:hypothetical protein